MFMKFTLLTELCDQEIYLAIDKIQFISQDQEGQYSYVHLVSNDPTFGKILKVKGKALDIAKKIARGVADQ